MVKPPSCSLEWHGVVSLAFPKAYLVQQMLSAVSASSKQKAVTCSDHFRCLDTTVSSQQI